MTRLLHRLARRPPRARRIERRGVNINQLDPAYLSLGSALTQQVANPFFGVAGAGPLATQATVQRRQLLRPFPQYQNINARQVTEGKSRYNAAVVEVVKRLSNGWGGRFSYTYSVLKDNQFAEGNFFSGGNTGTPFNLAFVAGSPLLRSRTSSTWYGLLDVPHRFVFAPMVELPFGDGKRWLNRTGLVDAILGGWTVSAIVSLESGFPINVTQSDNSNTFSGQQRPNLVVGRRARRRRASFEASAERLDQRRRVHRSSGQQHRQCAAHASATCARRGATTPTCRSPRPSASAAAYGRRFGWR